MRSPLRSFALYDAAQVWLGNETEHKARTILFLVAIFNEIASNTEVLSNHTQTMVSQSA